MSPDDGGNAGRMPHSMPSADREAAIRWHCPTEGCTVIPPVGFSYCREHAGSERGAYDRLDEVQAELDAAREREERRCNDLRAAAAQIRREGYLALADRVAALADGEGEA